ncbi:Diaminopropionate ammonia-lyase [Cupriavidus yeoncheonensis]|uniref:Diaminopropionate ammonia-lyase n=1 Tax=Cupriavidus yeoncheonensis TaxID=1462994 RepID=A0A916N747_9BURK|nr:diaminopropionate ammonia-lyase [Cupriavidus yeoncheonensis]CAG2157655.1 Diaminopropionate ammonia-lyase [Cupriavidus yeoncheonensis]
MLVENAAARRTPYDESLRQIMSVAKARESRHWLSSWSALSAEPTPLYRLDGLASWLGVGQVHLKDESRRATVGSFKALGAPVALARLILRQWPERGWQARELFQGLHADALRDFTVISATDGNHGRSLAAAAKSIGCRCVIVLHANVSEERETPIAALGAQVVRISGNYDASVQEAARLADENGWYVVSDTSYEGYEEIPRDVMQGYGVIAAEIIEQLDHTSADSDCPYTHVFLQGGVGGLAAGIVSYFCEVFGVKRPIFVVVEPEQADCLYQSAIHGRADRATGSVDSVMAGLACGETSPLAWRFLAPAVDYFITISDREAVGAMRLLAEGTTQDIPIVSGESGAAGLAGLIHLTELPELRAKTALDANARILLISTEGATAPAVYADLVGMPAEAVLASQSIWIDRIQANASLACAQPTTSGADL